MSKDNPIMRIKQQAFTIIELLVIAPIVILTIGAFVTAIVNMTGDVLASRVTNVLTYSIQDALNRIEEDVKLSTSFIAGNNVALTSPQGFNNATEDFSNNDATNGNMLILNTLATTGNPISTTSGLVYLVNEPNSCTDAQVNQNKPLTINVIYFIKDGTLWRRTVMPSNYATVGCTAPWQQPSCSPTVSDVFCLTQDVRLVDNMTTSDFNIQYFNAANGTIADTVANDTTKTIAERNTALQSLTTVSASISVNTTAAGRSISQSGTIRATKLDVNASTIAPIVVDVTPSAPTGVTATFNLPGQITVEWYPNATSYTLQYDTTSAFSAPTTISSIATSSRTITGLNESPQYFFRVSATNSAGTSGYSSTANSWSTIATGLQGWWMFNGNATDSSGSGMNGTLQNAPTLTTGQNGATNSAYNFNGVNQHITLPSGFANFSGGLTFSVWANPTTSGNFARFFDFGTGAGSNNILFYRSGTTTSLAFWVINGGAGAVSLTIANVIDNGTWNQYAVTMSSAGMIVMYKNGSSIGSVSSTLPVNVTRTINYIARSNWAADAFYAGRMDDARIYNRALSAAEISQLFANGAR